MPGVLNDMGFYAAEVPAKGRRTVQIEGDEEDGPCQMYLHVTNVALGEGAVAGPHCLKIAYDGGEFVVATLRSGHCDQHSLDFVIDKEAEFINTGPSPIFVSGYQTVAYQQDSDSDYSDGGEEDEDEDMMSSDDDEAPDLVPMSSGKGGRGVARAIARMREAVGGEDDQDEASVEKAVRAAILAKRLAFFPTPGESGEDDDDDEGEEGEDEDFELDSDDLIGDAADDDEGESEDDDDDEGEDDEGESESDDEDEEEEEEAVPTPQAATKKRPAPVGAPAAAPVAKAGKQAAGVTPAKAAAAAAAAPAATPKAAKAAKAPAAAAKAPPAAAPGSAPAKTKADKAKAPVAPSTAPPKSLKDKAAKPAAANATPAALPAVKKEGEVKARAVIIPKTPADEAAYAKELKSFISAAGGSARVTAIGQAIKKPASVLKMTAYLAANKDKFTYDAATESVKLA